MHLPVEFPAHRGPSQLTVPILFYSNNYTKSVFSMMEKVSQIIRSHGLLVDSLEEQGAFGGP